MSLSLEQWLSRLESLHPTEIELGLARIEAVYQRLEVAARLPKVVTVAGTNGKGSTVAMLEAIAKSHAVSVGAYTSPHLFHYNERVRINGDAASDDMLVAAFEKIEEARQDISLTYFEFGTLAALLIFAEASLDLVLLEVGLGGRLDATNIVDADIAVLTSVDIDHTDWLGDNRAAIAVEKCGIARRDKRFVCGEVDMPAEALSLLAGVGCEGVFADQDFSVEEVSGRWRYTRVNNEHGTEQVECATKSILHPNNVATVLQVSSWLFPRVPIQEVFHVASQVQVPGRQHWINTAQGTAVLVDVGHNPHAAASLAASLAGYQEQRDVICLIGMMKDKDIAGVIGCLAPVVGRWLATDLPGVPRAASGDTLMKALATLSCNGESFESPAEALDSLVPGFDGVLVVFGSFFTAAAALDYFGRAL